jgi:hypothetical protein
MPAALAMEDHNGIPPSSSPARTEDAASNAAPATGDHNDMLSCSSAQSDNPTATASKSAEAPPNRSSENERSVVPPPTRSSENKKKLAQGSIMRTATKVSKRKLATTDENRDPVDEQQVAGEKQQRKAMVLKPLSPADTLVNSPRPLLPCQNRGPAAYLKENGYIPPKKGSHSRKND